MRRRQFQDAGTLYFYPKSCIFKAVMRSHNGGRTGSTGLITARIYQLQSALACPGRHNMAFLWRLSHLKEDRNQYSGESDESPWGRQIKQATFRWLFYLAFPCRS